MKRLILLIAAAALAGCVSSLNNAQQSCSGQHAQFDAMWGCIKGRVSSGTAGMMNNEMGIRYMAFGDTLNERYQAGQISSADAKYLLAEELARANSDFNQTYRQGAQSGVGAALSSVGQSMQRNAAMNRPVTCTSAPSSTWVGGPASQVRTTCY